MRLYRFYFEIHQPVICKNRPWSFLFFVLAFPCLPLVGPDPGGNTGELMDGNDFPLSTAWAARDGDALTTSSIVITAKKTPKRRNLLSSIENPRQAPRCLTL